MQTSGWLGIPEAILFTNQVLKLGIVVNTRLLWICQIAYICPAKPRYLDSTKILASTLFQNCLLVKKILVNARVRQNLRHAYGQITSISKRRFQAYSRTDKPVRVANDGTPLKPRRTFKYPVVLTADYEHVARHTLRFSQRGHPGKEGGTPSKRAPNSRLYHSQPSLSTAHRSSPKLMVQLYTQLFSGRPYFAFVIMYLPFP